MKRLNTRFWGLGCGIALDRKTLGVRVANESARLCGVNATKYAGIVREPAFRACASAARVGQFARKHCWQRMVPVPRPQKTTAADFSVAACQPANWSPLVPACRTTSHLGLGNFARCDKRLDTALGQPVADGSHALARLGAFGSKGAAVA
jgi:hypothetical protein